MVGVKLANFVVGKEASAMKELKDSGYHRVIAFLNREEVDYLDNIGKNALFTTGSKLSRIKIIKTVVNVLKKLGVSGENTGSCEKFEEEILRKMKEYADKDRE